MIKEIFFISQIVKDFHFLVYPFVMLLFSVHLLRIFGMKCEWSLCKEKYILVFYITTIHDASMPNVPVRYVKFYQKIQYIKG